MSGGSWDYFYCKLDAVADRLLEEKENADRRALGRVLREMANALQAIEWVDSNDWRAGEEAEPIRRALGDGASALVLKESLDITQRAMTGLVSAFEAYKSQQQVRTPGEVTAAIREAVWRTHIGGEPQAFARNWIKTGVFAPDYWLYVTERLRLVELCELVANGIQNRPLADIVWPLPGRAWELDPRWPGNIGRKDLSQLLAEVQFHTHELTRLRREIDAQPEETTREPKR